jgi:hypothetical protein
MLAPVPKSHNSISIINSLHVCTGFIGERFSSPRMNEKKKKKDHEQIIIKCKSIEKLYPAVMLKAYSQSLLENKKI